MEGWIDRFFMHLSISHTRATHPFHSYIASTPSVKVNLWGMFPYSCSTEALKINDFNKYDEFNVFLCGG